MKKVLVLILALFIGRSASAQREIPEEENFTTRPFQFSFISPLGTNGIESGRIINQFSINILAGYAAGLDGVELGGFANLDRQQVKGVQIAGFLNYAGGYTEACQVAGFANIVADSSTGFQLAGFTNISKKHEGLQIAGFGNFATKGIKGFQLAGFINLARETEGSQIAGFLNISKRLKGLQLGVVNVVDSVEKGTPVGVFSYVKNGYNHWEFWTGEMLHLNTGIKFGTSKFYNILAVGAGFQPLTEKSLLGIGYGFGHVFPLPKDQLSLDALGYQLLNMEKPFGLKKGKFNQLYQVKLNYDFSSKHLVSFIGPSLNVLVQHNKQSAVDGWLPYAPYSFYSTTNRNTRIQAWVGAQAGIRF